MNLHVDERHEGGFAFFIDGDLQFDSSDEAIYHETLALPALCMAAHRVTWPLRVLICGGGDGLALRECLRFPGVGQVDLVDYSAEVVELGRTRFARLNPNAFDDARVNLHVADAWDFLRSAAPYDVILCDFTVPRSVDDSRVFSQEWYALVREALAPEGVCALNTVSPQGTPHAFWCLRKTVRAAGLSALPLRVCIPSFREQGYGAWGFMLASRVPLRQSDLRNLACPVATQQADLSRLWRGARFTRAERLLEVRVPVHRAGADTLMRLMLSPMPSAGMEEADADPYDLARLLAAIPISHPSHTREMVETLAHNVLGAVQALDIRRLLDALLRRAARLPAELARELRRLKRFLVEHTPELDEWRAWGQRVFAALVITMVLANTIAPDNAFAKGSGGLGHASMSRGFSGGFAGGHGFGDAGSVGSAHVSGRGFRGTYGHGGVTDIYGNTYNRRVFIYHGFHGHYYGSYPRPNYHGGNVPAPAGDAAEAHQAIFAADDDLMVLDNGDVVITLSDKAYLRAAGGQLFLMNTDESGPVREMYADPVLFDHARKELEQQRAEVKREIAARRDWLSWVGWTSALFGVVADDKAELRNMEDLDRRLALALDRLGAPSANAFRVAPPPTAAELFAGAYLTQDGVATLRTPDGWVQTDGQRVWPTGKDRLHGTACPVLLYGTMHDVMLKLQKELAADAKSDADDLAQDNRDLAALNHDLSEYQSLMSSYGADYEVDYGTDSVSAARAVQLTENDIAATKAEIAELTKAIAKENTDAQVMAAALPQFIAPPPPAKKQTR